LKKKPLLFLLFFILRASNASFSQTPESHPYYIQWDLVEGSGGYIVEVQSLSGDSVFSKQVDATTRDIELNIPAGKYQFHVVTLNNFLRFENATDWTPIEVLAYSAPVFTKINPFILIIGKPITLTLQADRMSLSVSAILISPSGKQIKLAIKKIKPDVYRLSGPVIDERGSYSLVLTNPPALATTKKNLISTVYPDPVITHISSVMVEKEQLKDKSQPMTIELTGTFFSPEVTVDLVPIADPSKHFSLPISTNSDTALTIELPADLKVDIYTFFIANAPDLPKKPGPQFTVADTAKPIIAEKRVNDDLPKTIKNQLALGIGMNRDVLFGSWQRIYSNPFYSASLFGDYYLTNNLNPKKGHAIDFSLGLRSQIFNLSSSTAPVYVTSTLAGVSLVLCPAITLSFPSIRLRYFIGAGLNHFSMETSIPSSTLFKHTSSTDLVTMTGLIIDYPISDSSSLGLANQFTDILNVTPFYSYSASLFYSCMVPIWR